MKKVGRPKIHQKQKRMSVSFSDEAWEILQHVKPGKVSELVSMAVHLAAPQFPNYFVKKEKKS